jgi:dTDP-4-amino-4,6-dideoxygalactose transaminase
MIKLFTPFVSEHAIQNAEQVLRSGFLAEGNEVKQFEHEFSNKFQVQNVVALNSGTSALELAYELAGIGEGDEVITPVLTCTATNLPLVRRKARIVFADIDYDLNINVEDVKRKITSRTKAIVFVHFGGNNRGLAELLEIGLPIIEDAAQAIGSDYWGHGDFTAVSFQAIKTLTTGDGGALICKRTEDYDKARRLRWFGYDREAKQRLGDADLIEAGYKYHMNDISASIGRGNLAHIDEVLEHKKRLAEVYRSHGLFAGRAHRDELRARPPSALLQHLACGCRHQGGHDPWAHR